MSIYVQFCRTSDFDSLSITITFISILLISAAIDEGVKNLQIISNDCIPFCNAIRKGSTEILIYRTKAQWDITKIAKDIPWLIKGILVKNKSDNTNEICEESTDKGLKQEKTRASNKETVP